MIKYELYDMNETRKQFASYGKFDTYDEAYQAKTRKYHEMNMLCGGIFDLKLDIREVRV